MNGHHPEAGDRLGGQNPAYGLLQHRFEGGRRKGPKAKGQRLKVKGKDWKPANGLTGQPANPAPYAVIGGTMIVLANFLVAVAKILDIGLSLYMWIIIGRAVISWVNPDPYNPIVRFLNSVTEPVLYPIRRRLPLHFGGIDFSPIIVILAIIFAQSFLVQTLYQFAARMSG